MQSTQRCGGRMVPPAAVCSHNTDSGASNSLYRELECSEQSYDEFQAFSIYDIVLFTLHLNQNRKEYFWAIKIEYI